MSTGDRNDMLARIQALLPRGWFGDSPTILTALLTGFAAIYASLYTVLTYARLQMRISSAVDGFLDVISADFFGASLPRKANESDTAFRNRITVNLFRERATRNAIIQVLTTLTGRAPTIVEPERPMDTGGYGIPTSGYSVAGAYGSMLLSYQAFVTAFRPHGSGIPFVAGYGSSPSGYHIASRGEYADLSMVLTTVADADIYAAIASVIPIGTIVWVNISADVPAPPTFLDSTFILDSSTLL